MPYLRNLEELMASVINDGSSASKKNPTAPPSLEITKKYKLELDKKQVLFMRNLLKAEIDKMCSRQGALSTTHSKKAYEAFTVKRNKVLAKGRFSKLMQAKHKDYPNHPIVCWYIPAKVGIDPNKSMFLKFLRHIGKNHTSIVYTWELFVDSKKNIEMFQEYCANGNLLNYVAKKKTLREEEISLYAWQLMRALDFLGDIGISHRDIHPKNLVLCEASMFNQLKLTNFRKAIIYWNTKNNSIVFVTCLSAKKQASEGKNYQAPEVYGDPSKERFDPIKADTWSFGAVIYYMATKRNPYSPKTQLNDLEAKIQKNVKKASALSSPGRNLLGNILRTNAQERVPIGLIENDAWFSKAKSIKVTTLVGRDKDKANNAPMTILSSSSYMNPSLYPDVGGNSSLSSSSSSYSKSTSKSSNSLTSSTSKPTSSKSRSQLTGCLESTNSVSASTCSNSTNMNTSRLLSKNFQTIETFASEATYDCSSQNGNSPHNLDSSFQGMNSAVLRPPKATTPSGQSESESIDQETSKSKSSESSSKSSSQPMGSSMLSKSSAVQSELRKGSPSANCIPTKFGLQSMKIFKESRERFDKEPTDEDICGLSYVIVFMLSLLLFILIFNLIYAMII